MTKIGMPLLACLAIILLACSPDAPTVGSPPTGTRVAEEPTNTPNPIAPPTVGSTSSISISHTGVTVHINAFGAASTH